MKPEPKFTLFHMANVVIALSAGIQAAFCFFAKYGLCTSVISFVAALILTYFAAFYVISYLVLWLWVHCPNTFRFWRLRFEAACYLLATLEDKQVADEIALWWQHFNKR